MVVDLHFLEIWAPKCTFGLASCALYSKILAFKLGRNFSTSEILYKFPPFQTVVYHVSFPLVLFAWKVFSRFSLR